MATCDNCPQHEKNDFRIQSLEENQLEIVKGLHELRERVTKAEESTKSAHHRLDEMTEQTQAVIRLAVSVEHIADQNQEILKEMKDQRDEITKLKYKPSESVDEETLEKIHDRLDVLEKKDGKNAEKLLNQIKWLLITLTISAAFALIWSQVVGKGVQ